MQGIMETLFYIVYLSTVIVVGIWMIKNSKGDRQFRLFGIMAVILGCGDAFHLIPRSYALLTAGLEANAAALGFGKLVTSITMTIFYLILYNIWRIRYEVTYRKFLSAIIYTLAAVRIALCCFPQNKWFISNSPLSWGIYRNIPFAILGAVIILLFFIEAGKHHDRAFGFMWLAITLSFGLYIPVVLFSSILPAIGILMIPKTVAYVWVILMGFFELRKERSRRLLI